MFAFSNYLQEMDLAVYLKLLAIVLPVYLIITWKFFLNIFDPLLSYVVMNSFSISLVVYMYLKSDVKPFLFTAFCLDVSFFWAGFFVFYSLSKRSFKNNFTILFSPTNPMNGRLYLKVSMVILLFASIALFTFRGAPIFSENPSNAKVELYAGGFGFVRYIQMIFPSIISGLSISFIIRHAILSKNSSFFQPANFFHFLCLVIVGLLLITLGGKSSLMSIVIFLGLGLTYLNFARYSLLYRKMLLGTVMAFFCAILYVFFVAFLTTGNFEESLNLLIIRSVASGDIFFFFYRYSIDSAFSEFGLLNFLHYLANPITSILRIENPTFGLGPFVLNYATGWPLSSFGPNAQFPVVGNIFFGHSFSWLFSFCLGMLLSFLRYGIIGYLTKLGTPGRIFYFFIIGFSTYIPSDLILIIQLTFMFFVFSCFVITAVGILKIYNRFSVCVHAL